MVEPVDSTRRPGRVAPVEGRSGPADGGGLESAGPACYRYRDFTELQVDVPVATGKVSTSIESM